MWFHPPFFNRFFFRTVRSIFVSLTTNALLHSFFFILVPKLDKQAPTNPVTTLETSTEDKRAPRGHWRNDLCDCCQFCGIPAFWCAFCCPACSIGQIMTRVGLNIQCQQVAVPMESGVKPFHLMIGLMVLYILAGVIPQLEIRSIVTLIIYISFVTYGTVLRGHMRKMFEIPGGCFEDCCCMFWCNCCSIIQMNSHTHDLFKYGDCAACTTDTGLVYDAPLVTEV